MILQAPNKEIRDYIASKRKEIAECVDKMIKGEYSHSPVILETNHNLKLTLSQYTRLDRQITLLVEAFDINKSVSICEAHAYYTYTLPLVDSYDIVEWCIAKIVQAMLKG